MPSEMTVRSVQGDGMHCIASCGEHRIEMDYPLQPDEKPQGPRPLEVLLSSLAGCSANTMALVLRKMQQPLEGLEVTVTGKRRDEHPTVFTDISLSFLVKGAVDPAVVQKALTMAEEQLCPVWAMLKGGTNITASFGLAD